MLSDEKVHERLLAWAWWRKSGGQAADGFPRTNVLHKSWQPPAPGSTPTLAVAPRSSDDLAHRTTDRAVVMLSRRLRDTVQEHYLIASPVSVQAQRLGCAESTVHERVREARRQLAARI